MIVRLILAILGGIGLGYGIAHLRYGNTESITQLRNDYRTLQSEYDSLCNQYAQITAAQELIKAKAKDLVSQNQDYAKIISQLNRYYYQLQEIRHTISGIQEKLGPQDSTFEKKLESIKDTDPLSPPELKKQNNALQR